MKVLDLLALILCVDLMKARSLNGRESMENAAGQTFDYIVVGCGITGLVVSSRLSEDEDVSVLCLEAGDL
jgi:choline dehydrogenase